MYGVALSRSVDCFSEGSPLRLPRQELFPSVAARFLSLLNCDAELARLQFSEFKWRQKWGEQVRPIRP